VAGSACEGDFIGQPHCAAAEAGGFAEDYLLNGSQDFVECWLRTRGSNSPPKQLGTAALLWEQLGTAALLWKQLGWAVLLWEAAGEGDFAVGSCWGGRFCWGASLVLLQV
jgi:hypothetical protein